MNKQSKVSPFSKAKTLKPNIIEFKKQTFQSKKLLLSFGEALNEAAEGYKITREAWGNTEIYGLIMDQKLYIRLEDKKLHEWIIHVNDINSSDWFTL